MQTANLVWYIWGKWGNRKRRWYDFWPVDTRRSPSRKSWGHFRQPRVEHGTWKTLLLSSRI